MLVVDLTVGDDSIAEASENKSEAYDLFTSQCSTDKGIQ